MKLFLVRVSGTTVIQGIFWSHTPTGLRHAVEEMGDLDRLEWAEMTCLGGVWREETADEAQAIPDCRDFPLSRKGEKAFGQAFDRALAFGFSGFGERLIEMMASQEDHVWTRFAAAYADRCIAVHPMRRHGKA